MGDLQQWRVPTKAINPDTSAIYPVPMGYEYGLGPAHLQHSCIYLVDITTQCNLSCPACFTSSSPAASHFLSFESILHAVRTAIDRENGRLDVVMLSGGEPTVHPQFRKIIDALAPLPIVKILVNTNGIRLANEDALLEFMASYLDRVEVYLQYDGQRAATHEALRGVDLREIKKRALRGLSDARIFTTLVMTVAKNNADQIGEVLDTAFTTRFAGGVMFQPLFGKSSRHTACARRISLRCPAVIPTAVRSAISLKGKMVVPWVLPQF
ncbi:MAG: radical SAM protein [Candidatus Eremiobacteraeota bacterium]|nr:radical SAM protein [Candidatus Eremiobacteraeota bacterium]